VVLICDLSDAYGMNKHPVNRLPPGKPKGTKTVDTASAKAFGQAVRRVRLEKGVSQEDLAAIADIERAHMGRIERGEKTPTLRLILKISRALNISSAVLMTETESILGIEVESE